MKHFSILALSCMLLASGCATIVSKTAYPISISSAPEKADIQVTDVNGREVYSGTTPTVVKLKTGGGYFKKQMYTVKFTKEGYDVKTMTLHSDFNGWYIGNLVFGGFIGFLIVDPISGAMWKFNQRDVQGVLTKTTASSGDTDGHALNIISLDDVPEELRSKMIPVKQD